MKRLLSYEMYNRIFIIVYLGSQADEGCVVWLKAPEQVKKRALGGACVQG